MYCCRPCQVSHLRNTGKIKNKQKKGAIRSCLVCGQDFYIPQYRKDTAKYCSHRCIALAHPENTLKARNASPIMTRSKATKGENGCKNYKTITVNGKSIREHRWIMEQHLGRKLETWEHVHHIDGNHLNNSIDNLEVLSNAEHQRKELEQWKCQSNENGN